MDAPTRTVRMGRMESFMVTLVGGREGSGEMVVYNFVFDRCNLVNMEHT
jgi:hypothetical protein